MGPSKKRKLDSSAVEEVTFDYATRHEYLTGFHKRKVERQKIRQDIARRRAREERIHDRKKLRDERKAHLAEHVKQVNASLSTIVGGSLESDSDTDGTDTVETLLEPPPIINHEDEYIDEEKYTTVTVQDVEVSRAGLQKAPSSKDVVAQHASARPGDQESEPAARKKTAPDKQKSRPPKKKRNFRYESRVDRKVNYLKIKARNSKRANARKGV